jgi:hypothetical protein
MAAVAKYTHEDFNIAFNGLRNTAVSFGINPNTKAMTDFIIYEATVVAQGYALLRESQNLNHLHKKAPTQD